VGHIARIRDEKFVQRTIFWSETLTGIDHSKDEGVDRMIILEWILGK